MGVLDSLWVLVDSLLSSVIDLKDFVLGYLKAFADKIAEYIRNLSDFAEWLYDVVIGFFPWLLGLIKALIVAFWDIITDFFSWAFSEILDLVIYILSSIPGLDALDSMGDILGSIPSEIMSIMSIIGIPECTVMIVTSLGIRLFLQIIPFTRLGS